MPRRVTKDTDRGARRILRELRRLGGAEVDVGYLQAAGDHPDADMPQAQLAAIHEFGAPSANIPERPTLRPVFDEYRREVPRRMRELMGDVFRGRKSVDGALNVFGAERAGAVKVFLTELDSPPNAPATIAAKGTDNPLIDKGPMRDSINHEVKLGR